MAGYISNRDGAGKTDEEGHYKFLSSVFSGNVTTGLVISATSPVSMNVSVSSGIIDIPYSSYSYFGWFDSATVLTLTAADTTAQRIDAVVAYVDRNVISASTDVNNPNALKLKVVGGIASAAAVQPSSSIIQTAIGINNPYVILGTVYVAPAVTSISNSNITNSQTAVSLNSNINATNSVNALPATKVDYGSFSYINQFPRPKILWGRIMNTSQTVTLPPISSISCGTLCVEVRGWLYTSTSGLISLKVNGSLNNSATESWLNITGTGPTFGAQTWTNINDGARLAWASTASTSLVNYEFIQTTSNLHGHNMGSIADEGGPSYQLNVYRNDYNNIDINTGVTFSMNTGGATIQALYLEFWI